MAMTDPALCRIQKRPEFLTVASKGNKVVASTLVLQGYFPTGAESLSEPAPIRVGFTVTKKNGGAVQRNRIRRRLKAAAQQILPDAGKPGAAYVVIGRHRALDEPFDIILRDLRYAVRKAAKLEAAKTVGEQP